MITIETAKQLKKYTDNQGSIYFTDHTLIEGDFDAKDYLHVDGNFNVRGNLDVEGNLNVNGDLDVKGYLYVNGNFSVSGKLICNNIKRINGIKTSTYFCIPTLAYHIAVLDNHIKIGWSMHTKKAWARFTDDQIDQMDDGALKFWTANKKWILGL